MLHNTKETYGSVAQILHWVTAALILMLMPLGLFMHELPINSSEEIAYKSWFYSLHKTLGVTVFGVAIIRVFWALIQPKPGSLNAERKLESFLASAIHWTLYGSIILMPLTGWLHHSALDGFAPIWWPFGQDLPFVPKNVALAEVFGKAHFLISILLMVSLVLHIAGALKHALIDRDETLKRILPGSHVVLEASKLGHNRSSFPLIAAVFCFLAIGLASYAELIESKPDANQLQQQAVDALPKQTQDSSEYGIARWVVDQEKSSLGISVIQNGMPVEGKFERWQADIIFDSENLEASAIQVSVDVGSLKLGVVTDKALDKPILNAKEFPAAEFVSKEIIRVGEGQYQANGELTLVGVTKPFVLPFDLVIENNLASAKAEAKIKRLDFGIGQQGFRTDSAVGFEVSVIVDLEARSGQ